MDNIIVFLGLSVITLGAWSFIIHVDTYFGLKKNHIKPEYAKEFTFLKYSASELKRRFTGKGLF